MLVIYSSGSTADPKGAVHSHGAPLRHAYNTNQFRDIEASDRIFSPMPFFWVGGFVFNLLSTMHAGAFLLCEEVFEPGATLVLLERERATVASGWPHYSKALAEHPSFASRDLSSIRTGNLYDVLPDSARPADPELRSNALGMTETCGPHTYDRMDVDLPERLRGSFGHAVPGVEHKVVDPATGAVLPPGEVGEICVRGYSLMLGLYKQEREDVFDRDGYYHTGDAGYFDADGVLFFKARLGEMIKTAGANVTPREVEVVIETLPGSGVGVRRGPARSRARPERRRGGRAQARRRARRRHRARAAARAALELQDSALVVVRGERRAAVHRQRQDRQEAAGGAARGTVRLAFETERRTPAWGAGDQIGIALGALSPWRHPGVSASLSQRSAARPAPLGVARAERSVREGSDREGQRRPKGKQGLARVHVDRRRRQSRPRPTSAKPRSPMSKAGDAARLRDAGRRSRSGLPTKEFDLSPEQVMARCARPLPDRWHGGDSEEARKVGAVLMAQGEGGQQRPLRVAEVKGDKIVLDLTPDAARSCTSRSRFCRSSVC